ncbi:glycosyltransferase family 39 protein [Streptomyces sp. NBC_00988]|uniref:glycosyltransferase family 39 protein n=1 Tax=Streptomyces sp. NBC_00988 TaxID=2903704 RepID=UPI00386FC0F8|nr:glycosyltransferase family 39 protein [Streptomyces sp. NBC_00988]
MSMRTSVSGARQARFAEAGGGDSVPPFARRAVVSLAGVLTLVLLVTSETFRYSGDELYYLAAGHHLAWGYVDQPPLVPLLARLMDELAPGSAVALRLPATLAVPAAVVVTALTAREFGGGRRAQLLAGAAFALAPVVLTNSHHLATTTLDISLWAAVTWLLVRWIRLRDDRLWPVIGVLTAVALADKYLLLSFWAVAAVALLVTGPKEVFRRPLVWAGSTIALLPALPGLVWQERHGLPQVAMGSAIAAEVAQNGGRPAFLPLLFLATGLVGGFLFCSGLWWLMRLPEYRPYRLLGWSVSALAVLLCATNGRPYYLAGLFPVCWAAAAVQVERRRTARWWRWVPTWPTLLVTVLVFLRGLLPLDVEWLGGADRYVLALRDFDWPGLTRAVDDTYRRLPVAERRHTVVITDDYGRAGVLARYGPEFGLPKVYSGSRGYWYFGTPPEEARTVIYVGPVPEVLRRQCGRLEQSASYVDPIAVPVPTKVPPTVISVCSGIRAPWAQLWPELRHL